MWRLILIFLFFALHSSLAEVKSDKDAGLVSELNSIGKNLESYSGQTGKKEAMKAIETAQSQLEPILKSHKHEIMNDAPAMTATLQVGALFCDIDPSYLSVEFILPLQKSKQFASSLKKLPKPDHDCIGEALRVLQSNDDS
jgi:hypothetical protein